MVLSTTSTARRQLRVLTRGKRSRADQRKAENGQQQDCPCAAHGDHFTLIREECRVQSARPHQREGNVRRFGPVVGEFREHPEFLKLIRFDTIRACIFTLFLYAIVTIIRLGKPGGLRCVVAESVLMRQQLLILNRGRKRAPNLRSSDRIVAGLCTLLMRPIRVLRSAIVLKPATLLNFHKMLVKQKYRLLFSPKRVRKPGPKGPTKELIDAVVEMKRRNQTWGYQRIAQQIALVAVIWAATRILFSLPRVRRQF